MTLENAYITRIHSEKKNKDYIKAVLICTDDINNDTKIYSAFSEYSDEVFDVLADENSKVDIVDINYKSALFLYGDNKKLILNRIF